MRTTFALLTILLLSSNALAQNKVDYEKDIRPILQEHCAHCHGPDEQESGLRLDRRVALLKGGDYGQPAIVPGKPEKSYLLEVISHVDQDMKMPPDEDKLSAEKIELITRWIKEGANWPGQMEDVVEEKTDHWSFQPVTPPEVPKFVPAQSNPIDTFLLTRLKQHKLSYSKPADPRTLIRRASIVLTGLAPTAEQTESFLTAFKINPDGAYTDLVDKLLASPHFGERWAQHWLDVIRWAETNGSESNLYRKNAWIYRDYVVRSFNQDTPYDQFLKEQIAGDTMGVGEATGYLVSGPHVPVATVGKEESARRQARADRMDEIMQTVGASAIGLTVGCARCHNHKFDPISIQDYYSMTAVFQDIEFGSRFPEFSNDHPRRVRGQELYKLIAKQRSELRKTGPWEEDWKGYKLINFPATETQSVRLTFFANSVRIDELEIFGPQDRKKNLASPNEADTSEEKDFIKPGSEIHKVNDGMFGTEAWSSKVPNPKETKKRPWIQFDFKEPQTIDRISVSTNREDHFEIDYLDKMPIFWQTYNVEVKTAGGEWKVVAGTKLAKKLDTKHASRVDALKEIQRLIPLLNDEGPKPSFVAKFIKPAKTHVFSRGSPESPRDEVFPAGPKQLNGTLGLDSKASGKKRRVAFANWIASSKHPLTARVAANRFWHHVFGQGVVTTTSDFGAAGSKPSHPELLDWLASELVKPTVDSGRLGASSDSSTNSNDVTKPWSMKHMIRLMVMSKAFRQSSAPIKTAITVDANSALLWRFPPKRMAAEAIRDSIVQASGSLDPTIGGKSFRIHNVKKRYAQWEVVDNHSKHTWRRMLYQERMRRVDDQMFTAFDFPDCGQVRAKRPVSTTPLQALNLLNSDFIIEQSELIAKRARTDAGEDNDKAVNRCFEILLGRIATEDELKACEAIAKEHNLAIVARAILNSNEFAFIQ